MAESSELPTLRKILCVLLCVLLLKGLVDGLECNMHQCTSYDKDIDVYHGEKAIVIKGTIEKSCKTDTVYSFISNTVQGQFANMTVRFSRPENKSQGYNISQGSLFTAMISYTMVYLDHDTNNVDPTKLPGSDHETNTVDPTKLPILTTVSAMTMALPEDYLIMHAANVSLDSGNIDIIILYRTLNTTTIERKIYRDAEHFDTSKSQNQLAEAIIKNNQTFADSQSVDVSPHDCNNLTLSLCRCEEPVITNLSHADNTLTCEGAGYPVDNLTVSWSIDGIGLSAEEPKRNRDSDTIISEIKDIPIPDSLTQYTCEIYNSVTNKSISESIPREMFPTQENDV